MADRPDLAGRASQRASAGSGSARQPDPAGQDDDGAPPRPRPVRRLAGSRDGLDRRGRLWGAPTGQGAGALKKMGALPAQSRGLLAPCDHQTRSRSNASRCIRCGHGGGSLGGCMGEYRRARGSLHVRGAFWLRSQVPIRRPKGPSFTHNEDIYIL